MLVVVILAAVNGYYFHRSRTPTFWDDSAYLSGSLVLSDALRDHGVAGFARAFAHLFGNRAPLICALPVPLYTVFGREFDPRFLIGVGFVILMSIYLFRIAENLWSPREGLLAVAILQTMPLMYGLSRQFLVDYGLATLVVMWIFYFHLHPVSGVWPIARLGLLLGLGALMKFTFPLYIAAPAAVQAILAIRGCRGWHDKTRMVARFGVILLVGGLMAAVWYVPNWQTVIAYARSASNGDISINYGSPDVFSARVIMDYFFTLGAAALSTFYAFSLALALVAWLLLPKRPGYGWGSHSWLLVAWVSVPFVIATFSVAKDPRYIAPLVPVAALWLSRTATVFCPPRRLLAASALLLTVPVFAYACSSFPFGERIPGFAVGRFQVWSSHLAYYAAAPGDDGAWQQAEIIGAVCHGPEPPEEGDRLLVLLSHKYLNNENLKYLTLRAACGLQVVGVPSQIATPEQVKSFLDQVRPKYVLIVPRVPEPELAPSFANATKGEAERLITSDPAFQQIYRAPLGATGAECFIYRRGSALLTRDALVSAVDRSVSGSRGVRFGDRFLLRGVLLTPQDEGLQMELFWESLAEQPLKYFVFVHLIDQSGKMLGQADYEQAPAARTAPRLAKAGEFWRDSVQLSAAQLKGATGIAFGIWEPPGTFLPPDRGDRDWDNRRLILPVPQDVHRAGSAVSAHYEGRLEHAGCDVISGWAWNALDPNGQIRIRVLNDGEPLMTLTADRPRPDLSAAGKGNGAHAFVSEVPAALKDGRSHSIAARTDDSEFELPNSPQQVTCK
jgi:hypothetical protein